MTERGILFSASMVRSLLAGKKTQTRRIIKHLRVRTRGEVRGDWPFDAARAKGSLPAGLNPQGAVFATATDGSKLGLKPREFDFACPYVDGETVHVAGEGWRIFPRGEQRLWVRETWRCFGGREYEYQRDRNAIIYRADPGATEGTWRPAIYMFRWASRITLEIVSVRVERLHAITEEDARAEGIDTLDGELDDSAICRAAKVLGCCIEDRRASYGALWAEINGEASLIANPWVWTISFKRIEARP